MGVISDLEKRMAAATGETSDYWYYPGGFFFGGTGTKTKAGSSISEYSAMQLAIVWCCIKILAEDSASLPLHLYRRLPGGGKERATSHPLYYLLHDQPNPEMTAFSFREVYLSHLLSWGNAYCEIERGRGTVGRSTVMALWPITPNRVTPKRNKGEIKNLPFNSIYYRISMTGTGLQDVNLPKEKILHTPGLGFNGITGYSPIGYHRETLGLGMSLEEFAELYFGQGLHPGVIASHPGKLNAQTSANMRESLNEVYGGLGKSHRLLLLEEGLKIEKASIPNDEAQFLESRKYTNIDIGTRIYRVPPYMYGEMDKTAFANVEQQAIDYVTKTLRPWLVRLEQSYKTALLTPDEGKEYFYEHLVDGLLRGDIKSRYDAYAVARQNGWMNADEIRELENMNPMEGGQGKIYLVPLNMIPAADANKGQQPSQQQKSLDNKAIYRDRIENAYRRLFLDAIGRITRQEAQRVNWIKKNQGNNGAMTDFYRDFPDFIKKQAFPVFLSYAEALTGMESELNGLKYDGFQGETQRFIDIYCSNFASDYIATSLDLEPKDEEWTEREAAPIADMQAKCLADVFLGHLRALAGMKS